MAPKQPTKGDKQIRQENETSLHFFKNSIIVVNVAYTAIRFLAMSSTSYWLHYAALVFSSIIYFAAFQFLTSMANQGIDLNVSQSFAEHAKDLIILTGIVQILSLLSDLCWLLWLVAPIYGFYLLWVNILGPWFFAPPPEIDEKQQRKMERKAKRQVVYR